MSLTCGNSAALDSITGKVDEIKAKLAEGMSALGDLESKANEALGELQAALPELPVAGPSLQGDVSALIAQMQTDAGGAIAAFKEAWGEALGDGELQEYIDLVTNAISDPLSLASFDPCEAIPNKELDSALDSMSKEDWVNWKNSCILDWELHQKVMAKKNTIKVCTGIGLNMFFPEYIIIHIPTKIDTEIKATKKKNDKI